MAYLLMLAKSRWIDFRLKRHAIRLCTLLWAQIAGAVAQPGIYELPADSLVEHAIEAAGGPLESAILDMINLAAPLEDGQQVFVPSEEGPPVSTSASVSTSAQATGELININTATAPELETLPGIGPSLAQKIVDYRDTNGPFLKPEDLLQVSGIGPSKFEQIRELITIR